MLATGLLTLGVKCKHGRINVQLIGDDRDDGLGRILSRSKWAAEIAHQSELDRKTQTIMGAAVRLGEGDIFCR